MNWYFEIDGQQQGPVSADRLVSAHQSGVLAETTLVWNESLTDWEPLSRHLEALRRGAASPGNEESDGGPMGICAYSGKVMPVSDMVAYGDKSIAPEYKDAFVQGLLEGSQLRSNTTGELVYAGFWIRCVAKIVDSLLMAAAAAAVEFPLAMLLALGDSELTDNVLIQLFPTVGGQLLVFLYTTIMVWKYGATLGKMAVSIKVIAADENRLSYGRSVARYFAEVLSSITFGIGYIIAAFDDEKRALHDHICATRVVMK